MRLSKKRAMPVSVIQPWRIWATAADSHAVCCSHLLGAWHLKVQVDFGSPTLVRERWLEKISSGLWGNILSTNQLSIVWPPHSTRVLLPTLSIDLWAHWWKFPEAMSQNSNHLKLASSTSLWVCCVPMVCTIVRVYSGWVSLEEGRMGQQLLDYGWSSREDGAKSQRDVLLWRFQVHTQWLMKMPCRHWGSW